MRTIKDLAALTQLRFLDRVIGNALAEGASREAVCEHLLGENVVDPDVWLARVRAKKKLPMLGEHELTDFGGRDAFRAKFGLGPAPEASASESCASTEQGDAEYLARRCADTLRFDHRRGRWLIADPETGLWNPDRTGAVQRLAVEAIRARQADALRLEDYRERNAAMAWAIKGEGRSRLANMIQLAQSVYPLWDSGDNWDLDPFLLGCANGVVDLRTGILRRAEPSERISLSTGVVFDPDAQSDLWDNTLRAIFPHPGLSEFVQRALGYSLTGDVGLDKWFLGHGGGRNGKGTVYGCVTVTIGDYALELPAETLGLRGKTYDLANLPGRRFVTCSEAGDTFQLNHDLLKKLTGGDRLRAANKYEKSFEFDPQCHLWLACNRKPQVTDDSIGFWSRVIVIPFTETFLGSDADPAIRTSLRDLKGPHVQAVLTWLVKGAVLAVRDGLGELPEVVRQATDAYRNESGPIAAFIDDECVQGPDAFAKASALRDRYVEWTNRTHDRSALNPKAFGMALRQRFAVKDKNDGAYYLGIGLVAREVRHDPPF